MYKTIRKKYFSSESSNVSAFVKRSVIHHSPSFFLRGGIDLSRKERRPLLAVPMHSDDVEGDVINVFADARTSLLDIAAMASESSVTARQKKEAQDIAENK